MYKEVENANSILNYLKNNSYIELNCKLWNHHLWFYNQILIFFENFFLTEDKRHDVKFFEYKEGTELKGIICIEEYALFKHILVITNSINGIVEFLNQKKYIDSKSIRVSMIDPTLASDLAKLYNCTLKNDYIWFYTENTNMKDNERNCLKELLERGWNIMPVTVHHAEIINSNIELSSKLNYDCSLDFEIFTWKIPEENKELIRIAEEIGFKKLYSEYYFDID